MQVCTVLKKFQPPNHGPDFFSNDTNPKRFVTSVFYRSSHRLNPIWYTGLRKFWIDMRIQKTKVI